MQLVTIHASKGLEYPVVYLPAVADRFVPKPTRPLFHDDAGERCLDVGGGGAHWADHCRRWADEEAGEWLRLLYVAITRAKSQVVCWWAPTKNAVASPLHRMLMRDLDTADVPDTPAVPDDDAVVALFAAWRDRGGPAPEPAIHADPGADPPLPDGPGPRRPGLHPRRSTPSGGERRTPPSPTHEVRARAEHDACRASPR